MAGPLAMPQLKSVVYQNPFYHYWFPRRDYPWYYDDFEQQAVSITRGQGQVIKRETIKTDATGKATLTFDTPRENYNQDFDIGSKRASPTHLAARSSPATMCALRANVTTSIHVAQQNIYRPKDKVTVDIKALDANEQPVTTEGTVKVTREYWWEIWIDPNGREVKGEELRLLREKPFSARVTKGQKPWRLKFRGYQHDDILTQTIKTDAEGMAQLQFVAERDGYYG